MSNNIIKSLPNINKKSSTARNADNEYGIFYVRDMSSRMINLLACVCKITRMGILIGETRGEKWKKIELKVKSFYTSSFRCINCITKL